MAPRISRINPRTGRVERPWRNREGLFVLADPAHGAQRHHEKFAVKVSTLKEAAALISRGFSIRLTDGESPPSLISPDSLTLEEVEDVDPASLYTETAPKPPFEKEAMMNELKYVLLVQASQIVLTGNLDFAEAFIGFRSALNGPPYTEDDPELVVLERFDAYWLMERSYDYAFQVGAHHSFDDTDAQNAQMFVLGANPCDMSGEKSPLAHPNGLCRLAAETAFGRWSLDRGMGLSIRELALLAQMSEGAVRNSLSKEKITVQASAVDASVARDWLSQRRDFVPTRSTAAMRERWFQWTRLDLDQKEFGIAFGDILKNYSCTTSQLAHDAKVSEVFLEALTAGDPPVDIEKLQRVGQALDLDVPHFVGTAIEAALRARET